VRAGKEVYEGGEGGRGPIAILWEMNMGKKGEGNCQVSQTSLERGKEAGTKHMERNQKERGGEGHAIIKPISVASRKKE